MIDILKILNEPTDGQSRTDSMYLWIVVATIPFLFQLPSSDVPVWALGLVFGVWIANKHILRWIALAWIITVFFPTMPFLLLACSGALLTDWRHCIYAAVLGSALCLIPVPGEFGNMGAVLIIVGLISIIYRKVKLFKGAYNETS